MLRYDGTCGIRWRAGEWVSPVAAARDRAHRCGKRRDRQASRRSCERESLPDPEMSTTRYDLTWRTLRIWNGAQVVHERQYDHQQTGGPLTLDDFAFNTAHQVPGFRRQS